jgi:hypothetical protein
MKYSVAVARVRIPGDAIYFILEQPGTGGIMVSMPMREEEVKKAWLALILSGISSHTAMARRPGDTLMRHLDNVEWVASTRPAKCKCGNDCHVWFGTPICMRCNNVWELPIVS